MMPRIFLVLFLAATALASSDDEGIITDPERILVFGHVKKPGPVSPAAGLTLTMALEQVDGFADFADRRHILIWRSTEKRFFKANESAIRRKEEVDPLLYKGDVVIVGARLVSQ
jgi:protein involved in polysaccharide export with SLBB domain